VLVELVVGHVRPEGVQHGPGLVFDVHEAGVLLGERVQAALAQQVADVTTVTSWSEWKAQVLSRPRDLLVLMPHSDQSSTFAGIPALEVSKDELAASNLNEKYVNTGAAHGPLVLLLGCSTSFADLPFLNFVRRCHLKAAPVVVGTLSVVHATQARDLAP
jgi:hypothetical protein